MSVQCRSTLEGIPADLEFLEILNHLSEMVWVMRPDGDILWVNQTYLDYFGDTFQKLVVENGAWDRIHPDDIPATLEIVKEWYKGSKAGLHYRLKRHDGMYRWFLARCSIVRRDDDAQAVKYLIGTITDIHDQKVAEEKAKELEDQLITVIDHAPVAIWAADMNGVYTMYKGKIIEQTGTYPEWFIGKCIYDITQDTPEISDCARQAMRGESPTLKDQPWGGRYFDLFYSPKRDRFGNIIGVVCIGVDITSRKEAAELAIKEKSARETAKLRSIFLANVSHELRTPLNGIMGLAELVLHSTNPALDPQHLTYVESIHTSALSLLTIINQILDFSRIDSGRMELECIPFNIKALVYEQVSIIKPLLQMQKKADRVQLLIDIADNVPDNFEGDPTRIAQVLLNLLSNAVKFTDKGSVSVKLHKVLPAPKSNSASPKPAPLLSKASSENIVPAGAQTRQIHTVQFSVTDSGIGISKEVQRILFEPFTQATPSTKRRYGGTGLGLSICDKLVNLMNGKLDVESDEGKGATFWFQIPLIEHPYHLSEERYAHLKEKFNANLTPNMTPEKPINENAKTHPSKPNSLSFENLAGITGRLLIAEDHPVNRMLLVALLNKLGHQVTAVENGNQVVTEFVRSKTAGEKPYDLILMDCQMPEVDGYQATRFIREKEQEFSANRRRNSLGVSPDSHSPFMKALDKNSMPYWKDRIPIIAITANAIETNQDKCYEAGMDDFVTKPITLQKVAQLIEKWLKEKHDLENEKNML